ncbi:family S53 protease [Mycena galericulata]|nr:family S53 protease [Mycena galericulata]
MVFAAIFLASLLLIVSAKPMDRRAMAVHESRDAVPNGFVNSGPAPATKELTLHVALKPNNISGIETTLYAVSDPASALYGQYLTQDEVATFVKPTDATISAVSEWLSENGISSMPVTPAGDMLQIVIPVGKANELLSTEFSVFTHVDTSATSIRMLAYSIPAALQAHIDFFHPTTSFTRPLSSRPKFTAVKKRNAAVAETAPVSDAVAASCATKAMYNIPTTRATQTSAVSGYVEEYANQADLQEFLTNFRTDMNASTTFTTQTIDGGVNPQTPAAAPFTVGIATIAPVTFISVGETNTDGLWGFMDIITALIKEAAGTPPNVLSTSYGFNENELSSGGDVSGRISWRRSHWLKTSIALSATLTCSSVLWARTSIIFSYGDGGVSGSQADSCTEFLPVIPSTCPFVASVGATGGIVETAASFSAGGFSNYFAVPSYQTADVPAYLSKLGTTNNGLYNRTGRGFPDASAQGEN